MTKAVVVNIRKDQLDKARAAANFGKITGFRGNKPSAFLMPGSDGKQYRVYFRREGGIINAECFVQTSIGEVPCKGGKRICYHMLAALIMSAENGGYKLVRNNGEINKIYQEKTLSLKHKFGKVVKSFVFYKEKKKKSAETALKELGF